MKQTLLGSFLALLASCIFGAGMWWIALASRAGWGNYALGLASAGLGWGISYLLYRRKELHTPRNLRQLWPFLRIGLALFAANVCMFLALRWIEPSIVSFFAGLQVLWVALIELSLRQLRLNFALALSILLCLAGTLFINEIFLFRGQQIEFQLQSYTLGDFLAMLSGIFFGCAIFLIRRAKGLGSPAYTTALLNLVVMLGNLIVLLGLLGYQFANPEIRLSGLDLRLGFIPLSPLLPWIYPILLGLGSFFSATMLQVHAQKYLSGTQVGLILSLQPLATIALGLLFFHSSLNLGQSWGGTMLLAASMISIMARN